jgi:hypothetical protein
MNAGHRMKSPWMAVLGLGTIFAGVLVAATGQSITTPNENDGIQPDFAFRAGIPFASLKEVATWHEAEQLARQPVRPGHLPGGRTQLRQQPGISRSLRHDPAAAFVPARRLHVRSDDRIAAMQRRVAAAVPGASVELQPGDGRAVQAA